MSGGDAARLPGRRRDGTLALVLALLVLAGLVVRAPLVGLPLDATAARLATAAAGCGSSEASGEAPLAAWLVGLQVRLGATPTGALRGQDLLLALAIAPLAWGLARRGGLPRRSATLAGLLVATHPLLVAHAGGALAGGTSLATVLLLLAWGGVAATGAVVRRLGALGATLLPLAEPVLLVHVPVLLVAWLRREPSARARSLVPATAVAFLLLVRLPALGPFATAGGLPGRLALLLLGGVPLAALVVGLPALPGGLRALAQERFPRPWLLGAALHVLALAILPLVPGSGLEGRLAAAGTPLVPLVVVAAVAGGAGLSPPRRRATACGAVLLALAGSLFLAWGPLQTFFLPQAPLAAGRLDRLGRALAEARTAAGPGGAIAVDDLGPGTAPVASRLADLGGGHPVRRLGLPGGDREVPGLPALTPDDVPAGRTFAVLTRYRPWIHEVTTLGGEGIFVQTPVARIGPWLVLRVRRP